MCVMHSYRGVCTGRGGETSRVPLPGTELRREIAAGCAEEDVHWFLRGWQVKA